MFRSRLWLITPLLAALALVACGGSSSSTSSTTAGAGVSPPSDAVIHARLELAKCMRAHGVDVPDAAATGTAGARAAVIQLISHYSMQQIDSAAKDCRAVLVQAFPALNLSPAQLAQRRQQVLAFVRCLRAHGINLPDPTSTGFGAGLGRALSNIDLNSPAFKAANTACASLRPPRLR